MKVKNKTFSYRPMFLPYKIDMEFKTGLKDFQNKILNMPVTIKSNYYDGFSKLTNIGKSMPLNLYYKNKKIETQYMCPEDIIQDNVLNLLKINIPQKEKGDIDYAVALVHAGKKGSLSPLHFDWDFSYILHTCITGTKIFYFFPPEAGWLLDPILNTSAIDFARLNTHDKENLIKKLGGKKVIINPGQAVQFPSLWWHCVEYPEDSIGISIRIEKDTKLRPFAVLPRSWILQRLIWSSAFKETVDFDLLPTLTNAMKELLSKNNYVKKYESLNEIYKINLLKIDTTFGIENFKRSNFNSELILASQEIKNIFDISTLTKTAKKHKDLIPKISRFIFKDYSNSIPENLKALFTTYAINKLKGLEPKVGIIKI